MSQGVKPSGDTPRTLVIGCGALAREVMAVLDANGLTHVDLQCLPSGLHNRPDRIPSAVEGAIRLARPTYGSRIFVAYADCGTGGQLDRVLEAEDVRRLDGPHCYAVFSGLDRFMQQAEDDLRVFYLTDFLARQFETLVIEGLGIDRHPELMETYFQHYEKLVYLAQTADPALEAAARDAASRLGLPLEIRRVGYGDLGATLVRAVSSMPDAGFEKGGRR